MKRPRFTGVPFRVLSRTESLKLRSQEDRIFLPQSSYSNQDHGGLPYKVYSLQGTGQYLYEFKNGGFLFDDFLHLQAFVQRVADWSKSQQSLFDRFQQVESFCDNIPGYVKDFQDRYSLHLNFCKVRSLEQVDNLINADGIDMDEEYLGLVAVVGTYLITNISGAGWRNTILPDDRFYPSVYIGDAMISVVDIIENEAENLDIGRDVKFLRPVARIIRLKQLGTKY